LLHNGEEERHGAPGGHQTEKEECCPIAGFQIIFLFLLN
jgi:hypothetical protein